MSITQNIISDRIRECYAECILLKIHAEHAKGLHSRAVGDVGLAKRTLRLAEEKVVLYSKLADEAIEKNLAEYKRLKALQHAYLDAVAVEAVDLAVDIGALRTDNTTVKKQTEN